MTLKNVRPRVLQGAFFILSFEISFIFFLSFFNPSATSFVLRMDLRFFICRRVALVSVHSMDFSFFVCSRLSFESI